MKILMMVLNQTGKGTYHRAIALARELVTKGNEVTLFSTSQKNRLHVQESQVEGVHLVEFPDLWPGSLRSGWDPWGVFRRIVWLRNKQYDVVHAFQTRPVVIYPALFAQKQDARLVLDWSDWFGRGGSVEERPNPILRDFLRPIETFYEEAFRNRAEATVVICTTLRDKAISLGVPAQSILLARHGSEFEDFPRIEINEARKRLNLPPGAFLIGYVGRIFSLDARMMAEAFDLVKKQIPEARLVVAGYCQIDLRNMVQEPDAVTQTGPLEKEELFNYLSACDLFWLPLHVTDANRGRWPSKINDYMAAGRPTIATDVGDVSDLIRESQIGLISPDNPPSFAEKTHALYQDLEMRRRMGDRARTLASTQFRWDKQASKLIQFYREQFGFPSMDL